MVAQVVVHAKNRNAAADKLIAYLDKVTISGICTNIPLLKLVLADDVFRKGKYDTDYLPELLQRTDIEKLIIEIDASSGSAGSGIDRDSVLIDGTDELKVLAPATAIFYSAPSPSEPEYVSVGDVVDLNHTLCQLEAMKIFNPVALKDFNADGDVYDSSKRYRVTRVNMSNGQQVNVGDLLFVVAPVT